MSSPTVTDLIREVGEDNTSGAAELTRKGAEVLVLLANQTAAPDAPQFLSELLTTGKALIQAQPSMAPLFNLVNAVLSSLETIQDADQARRAVKAAAQTFVAELDGRVERIALEALSLLSDGSTVFTHSRSSTVLRAFLLAKERGRPFSVVCTESRPMYEGREVARELAQAGIETTLVVDSAVGHFVGQANTVMVGADSVSSQGLVNKMGTYGLALAAKARGVPFYALCGTDKFLPLYYPYLEIERKDPREVWEHAPEGITVLNYYFDVTPLEYLSGLVTERGVLPRSQVERMLRQLKVHELLP
jgi:eIF-2B alpha/beta/delta-like uncharacterized protein